MAKNKLLLILIVLLSTNLNAQDQEFYWIELNDKTTSIHSVSNPSTFLTQKSIDRRTKQNIPITEQDLPVPQSYIDEINDFADVEIHNVSKWMNAILIKTNNTTSVDAIKNLSYVKGSSFIQTAGLKNENEYNHKFEEPSLKLKNNLQSININTDYGDAFNQIHMHNGETLHNAGYSGENMSIAVIDAGFTGAQGNLSLTPAYVDNRILGTRNFVENSNLVYKSSTHGTYVLTTMAGDIEGSYVGTAPKANYWLLLSEDVASETIIEEYYWLFAAEYADSVGVDVINTSLGYTEFDDPSQNHTYADMDGNTTIGAKAADIAASKGMLLFNSNGNSGNNSWKYLGTPADADSVIAVGATDPNGIIAGFSSLGPASDGDIKPNIAGQGAPSALYHNDGYVTFGSGTSFSGPILCGLGACLWQVYPDKTNMEIKDAIEKSAHIYSSPDEFYGYGIPDFSKASTILTLNDPTKHEFTVFPTLFNDELTITFSKSSLHFNRIEIINLLGEVQFSKDVEALNEREIHLTNLSFSKGVYFISIYADNTLINSTKVIKH